MHPALSSLTWSVAALAIFARTAPAQCTLQVLPGDGVPGVSGSILATTMWDPDGSGPQPPQPVVGGTFRLAGDTVANGVAALDLASGLWSAFGLLGSLSKITCLAVLPNGTLVAGGFVQSSTGMHGVAWWNGTDWAPLGSGLIASFLSVQAMAVLPNGDLVAGGYAVDGTAATALARWDGVAWTPMAPFAAAAPVGSLLPDPWVGALHVQGNGDLVVAGRFATVAGVACANIARWDGTAWSAVGAGIATQTIGGVTALAGMPNGDLIAGGAIVAAGGTPLSSIARWDGATWNALGAGSPFPVTALAVLPNGDLAVASTATIGNVIHNDLSRWDGATWTSFGPTSSQGWVETLRVLPGGDLLACGSFRSIGGTVASNLARWNGAAWQRFGTGTDAAVEVLVEAPDGDLLAGGQFRMIGGVLANGIARWNGTTWVPLGSGLEGSPAGTAPQPFTVRAIASMPNGDIVAAGSFETAGGVSSHGIARWDGATWHAMGTGASYIVECLAVLPNGDLVAGGSFTNLGGVQSSIARWDGVAWNSIGLLQGPGGDDVLAMAVLPDGSLVAAGRFRFANGTPIQGVGRWDGTAWSSLGSFLPYQYSFVTGLAVRPDGDLVAVGHDPSVLSTRIDRWNGTTWNTLGSPPFGYDRPVLLPDGDVAVFDTYLAGAPLQRWNGSSWQFFGPSLDGRTNSLLVTSTGDVLLGGDSVTAAGQVSPFLARLVPTCPATAVPFGTGCVGSNGTTMLSALALPWERSIFRSRATGLPLQTVALSLLGFGQLAIPLPTLFPQGVGGCDLLSTPDRIDVLLALGGSLDLDIPVISTPPLLGVPVYHQVVAVEFDPQFQFVAVVSTNGLTLTVGTY